jgi:soluble lytic murein transglycosylase-like protein
MLFSYSTELEYLDVVQQAASANGIDPAWVLAEIRQESGFKPDAYRYESLLNDASYGMMQLLLATAKTLDSSATATKLYDPTYNIGLGCRYLAKQLSRYGGNINDATAAYNAGSVFTDQNGNYTNSKGNTSVQDYVNSVMGYYVDYSNWLSEDAPEIDTSNAITGGVFFGIGVLALYYIIKKLKG